MIFKFRGFDRAAYKGKIDELFNLISIGSIAARGNSSSVNVLFFFPRCSFFSASLDPQLCVMALRGAQRVGSDYVPISS